MNTERPEKPNMLGVMYETMRGNRERRKRAVRSKVRFCPKCEQVIKARGAHKCGGKP